MLPLLGSLRNLRLLYLLLPRNHPSSRSTAIHHSIRANLTSRSSSTASSPSTGAATVATSLAPLLEVGIAVLASAALDALRVEASVLVKRDLVLRVAGAEDVTTATAVVAAGHEGEADVAGGAVAFGRGRVGLEKGKMLVDCQDCLCEVLVWWIGHVLCYVIV